MDSKPRYSIETIKANAPVGVDPWLPGRVVAEIIGFDEKWLANAREGRKNIKGPPYVKVGEGRTAPIRYRLSALISWMASFEDHASTLHRVVAMHRTFACFMDNASETDRWLFVMGGDGRSATDLFDALQRDTLPSSVKLEWLTRAEYTNQRFVKASLRLDAVTMKQLLELGFGDLSAGIAKLMGKSGS